VTSDARRRFIVSQQVLPGVINALINGVIAWAMHRGASAIGLWDRGAYATDLLATGFLLPAITFLIIRPLLRRQAAAGKGPALAGVPVPRLARLIPSTLLGGSAIAGLLGTAVGAVLVLAMHALGAPAMTGTGYAVFKGAYGGLLSIALQPAMVFAALGAGSLRAAT
jgi:hypothetical protein